jgi:hypothetical protein
MAYRMGSGLILCWHATNWDLNTHRRPVGSAQNWPG